MALQETVEIISLVAKSAIASRGLFVEANSGGEYGCSAANADTDRCLGVAMESALSGEAVAVGIAGIIECKAGAAVAIGNNVGCDSSGRAIQAASGKPILGTALTAASGADEFISVLVGYQGFELE
jgi:hypothetical protein